MSNYSKVKNTTNSGSLTFCIPGSQKPKVLEARKIEVVNSNHENLNNGNSKSGKHKQCEVGDEHKF